MKQLNTLKFFKKLLFSFLLIFSLSNLSAQTVPIVQWQKSFGGNNSDVPNRIIQTKDGGYAMAGYSTSNNGDVTGNHGGRDFWIVKMDANRATQWQRSLGGSNDEFATRFQQTKDGGYILVGQSSSNNGDVTGNHGGDDYWVVKLDSAGTLKWQKSFGGSGNDIANYVVQTKDSGYIIVGNSQSNDGDVTGNHGDYDYWIVKIDTVGNIKWQKSLGGTGRDIATCVQETYDGKYIIGGFSASNNGDVNGNHGLSDFWVTKLDATGTLLFQKSYGGSGDDFAYSIQETRDDVNFYVIAGSSNSNNGDVTGNHGLTDSWVIKINTSGILQWQKSLGGTNDEHANVILQTADTGYIVGSQSYSNNGDVTGNNGSQDFWFSKLNSNGTLQWQKSLGGTGDDYMADLVITSDGGYAAAGPSASNNGDVTGNHGSYDFWMVKLANAPIIASSKIITTVAGTGTASFSGDGGTAASAILNLPYAVATDATGNIYLADRNNHRIRKITTDGIITTIAGNAAPGFSGDGGTATSASLLYPYAIALDKLGNIFIADWGNNRIRKIATNGIITTVAGNGTAGFSGDGGTATSASLNNPTGVSIDAAGNIFIADYGNNRIRKVSTNNFITTVAGNGSAGFSGDGGTAITASLNNPYDVISDAAGNLYIADFLNHRIRKVSTDGTITTVVGKGIIGVGNGSFSGDGGTATSANIHGPTRIIFDSIGNFFIADYANQRIRRVNTSGVISTVAGTGVSGFSGDGGLATSAQINSPTGIAVDKSGNLFIADLNNHRIRKVTNSVLPLTLLAFNGQKQNTSINLQWTTVNEINTALFTVQRSSNGSNFTNAGSVAAGGNANTNATYTFTDLQPNSDKNYYRLKMTDKDGSFTYSSILVISLQETALTTFKLSPNPAKNYLQLQVNSKKEGAVNIAVFDAAGKTIITQKSSVRNGINVITINNINTLKSGFYFVQMMLNGETTIQKLTVE